LKYLTLVFLVVLCGVVRGQNLQGIVTDAATGKPLFPVTIVNLTTQQVTTTKENGFYTIPAKAGETVAFTFIGYKAVERVKPTSVIIATLNIRMEPTEYRLRELKIRPGHLTKYQIDSLERVQTYKIQLQRRPPSALVSPASALAEKFSKKAKRTYQFQKDFAAGEIEKFVDTRYTPELVSSLTGLTGDSLGHFMNTFPMPYDFARTASELELQMWIRNNYKQWAPKSDTTSVR
jgi:hypothetical protein